MRSFLRRLARHALATVGLHVKMVGPGTYLVGRRPWPSKLRLADVGPHSVLMIDRSRLSRIERWRRDKRLMSWVGDRHLADVLRQYKVNVVLDAGANVGQYGQLLRRIGYRGAIVSFEPVPQFHTELAAKAAADDLWTTHNLALGREDGTAEMNMVPNTMSSLLPASEYGTQRFHSLQETTTIKVPVRRLDGILDEILGEILPAGTPPRVFLKMDTQGYDLEAFAGLGRRLEDVVGLQSELALLQIYDGMPRMPEALSVYEAAGFEVTGLFPVNVDPPTLRVLEYDCVMVRASRLEK
jgi:FkbM family methyltransferase